MRLQHIPIPPLLRGYIETMWIFESDGRALAEDIKLIVPNGRIKIAIPYRNALVAAIEGCSNYTPENSITLVGLLDKPSTLDIATDNISGTICAELSPHGAYHFFHLSFAALTNKYFSLTDILGNKASLLQEQIANAASLAEKVFLFQQFLAAQFLQQKEDALFEYCVQEIKSSHGKITIKELEKKTGYSSRWLNVKFTEKLGISPKNLASIIRFKSYYEALCGNANHGFMPNDFYDYYYDQSHFIKNFKRFTSLTPKSLEKKLNNFGRIFYNA